jgi:DNA-binding HxlR family transcriptional regulator
MVLSRLVKFWRDPRDIKLAIMETMADFSRREDLVGWIPGNEGINAGALAEELARLAKENAALRQQVASKSPDPRAYNALSFEEMYKILSDEEANISEFPEDIVAICRRITDTFEDSNPGLLHLFWLISKLYIDREMLGPISDKPLFETLNRLYEFGLVERVGKASGVYYRLTETGRQFLLRLRLERDTKKAEQWSKVQLSSDSASGISIIQPPLKR